MELHSCEIKRISMKELNLTIIIIWSMKIERISIIALFDN